MHIRCSHCERLAAVAHVIVASGRTVLIATCAACMVWFGEPHEPPAGPAATPPQVAVAFASGAPGTSLPPFGWNSTAQELPLAWRHRAVAAAMNSGSNPGWLVQLRS